MPLALILLFAQVIIGTLSPSTAPPLTPDNIIRAVETDPVAVLAASPRFYVPRSSPADHERLRAAWLSQVTAHPDNISILLNAAYFLAVEDKDEAKSVLERASVGEPARKSAHLGFLYALDVLSLDNMTADLKAPLDQAERTRLKEDASRALDVSSDPIMLAAATMALRNLVMRATPAGPPDEAVFQRASALMERARTLAPHEPLLDGPMPLVPDFETALRISGQAFPQPAFAPTGNKRITVGGNIQKAMLIEAPKAVCPELAQQARITGTVRLRGLIGPDGRVQDLTIVSGHPLLVQSAIEAVRKYLYKPTLLNGQPVEVVTQIDVPFPPE